MNVVVEKHGIPFLCADALMLFAKDETQDPKQAASFLQLYFQRPVPL
jgi:hypothetical protein